MRLSGSLALQIAQKITRREKLIPRTATLTALYHDNTLIDEAIVIYFQSPKSFTGECIVEFQTHGGQMIAQMIVDACMIHGARLAQPGEFSKRAVLNGKIDIAQAEAIAAMIESKSEDSVKILAKQLKGNLGQFIHKLREELVETLAFVEVGIDYAEEDLDPKLLERIDAMLQENIALLDKSVEASRRRRGLLEGFRICIIGKPNVGKSSLLNALLCYDRAITSDLAGTTRDTIEEEIRIGTHLVKIVDTAGIRESGEQIEKIGIERSIQAIEESEIVLALFDRSRAFDEDDETILSLINRYKEEKTCIIIENKADLPPKLDPNILQAYHPILLSKDDTAPLITALQAYLDTQSFEDDLILINQRQIDATQQASDALKRAKIQLEEGEIELFAYEINEAIEAISSLTKPFERDEILDQMFGNFCLGK